MKTRQIPATSLPTFVVLSKSLNSSFTHCKMRLYHLLYGFPVYFCEDKGKCHAFKDTIFPIVNVKQVVYELMLILPIRKLTQSLNGLLQMVSRKGTRNWVQVFPILFYHSSFIMSQLLIVRVVLKAKRGNKLK